MSILTIKLNSPLTIYLYPIALFFIATVANSATTDLKVSSGEPKKIYICPPCDHPCDTLEFDHPGVCPQCGMQLTEKVAEPPASADSKIKIIEADIVSQVEKRDIPSAAVALCRDGKIVYENAVGWADRERKIAATVDTPYPLASASKPMVATALMVLVEQGKVKLDGPALRFINGWRAEEDPLGVGQNYSVRQLLDHTSGLGTYASIAWGDNHRPPQSLADGFKRYGFAAHPPGMLFEYSNLGYGLIGQIIAEQSGQTLANFMESAIFKPLGMRATGMFDSFDTPETAAKKYDGRLNALAPTYNNTPGGGNIYSSVHDLARFGLFHLADGGDGKEILRTEDKQLMQSWTEPGAFYPYYNSSHYGLGWYFRIDPTVGPVVWHEGGMPGGSAIILLLPQQKVVAVALINATDKNSQAEAMANALIKVVVPTYTPLAFKTTEGFEPLGADSEFLGEWDGQMQCDGKDIPCSLTFETGGKIRLTFPHHRSDDLLPAEISFVGLLHENLLVATIAGTLPLRDVEQRPGGTILIRLLRQDHILSGIMVAYDTPARLEYLYPCAAKFKKKER